MESLNKDKLAARVKMHLAAQTPSESGVKEYDKEGDNDQEKCDCIEAMKAIMAKHDGGHGNEEY
jgi:hypothetical protein